MARVHFTYEPQKHLALPVGLSFVVFEHKSTCGSKCISGSICGLRKGKRITLSPRLSLYCCPLAIRSTLSPTTTLLMKTAAVRRRVSLRMLSAERKGQWSQVSGR